MSFHGQKGQQCLQQLLQTLQRQSGINDTPYGDLNEFASQISTIIENPMRSIRSMTIGKIEE
ncbi:hypothetical protein MA16_Dca003807 [Dendrobium catenatum]|uniref:Uncharacterized protein n=1 Tax=Dendrobium catenatum TaxID=906689 RepID=A0A2I0X1L4_9ASPA|nr:hypothetical protein MA16_Dca003807 [Dendrobium catenatum]